VCIEVGTIPLKVQYKYHDHNTGTNLLHEEKECTNIHTNRGSRFEVCPEVDQQAANVSKSILCGPVQRRPFIVLVGRSEDGDVIIIVIVVSSSVRKADSHRGVEWIVILSLHHMIFAIYKTLDSKCPRHEILPLCVN
jgi:hypothetical protein